MLFQRTLARKLKKKTHTKCKYIFTHHTSGKGLVSRIYEEHLQFNNKDNST